MLNLPKPPYTRISRQLTCVSCHESFAIAEDDPVRDTAVSDNWRLPTNNYPDIQLRYQAERSRRSTSPEYHAIPDQNEENYRSWSDERREPLYCPRCGADNRNWLNIINSSSQQYKKIVNQWLEKISLEPHYWRIALFIDLALIAGFSLYWLIADVPLERTGILFLIIVFLASLLPVFTFPASVIAMVWVWLKKVGIGSIGIIATMGLVVIATNRQFATESGELGRSVLFILSIFVSGVVATLIMIGSWRSHRQYKAIRTIVPAKSIGDKISPPMKIWLWFTAVFLIIIPVFFFILVPGTFHLFSTVIEPEPEPDKISLDEEIENLQSSLLLFIIRPETLEQISQTFGRSIQQKVEESLEAAYENKKIAPAWLGAEEAFFRTWFKFVLSACIASLVFAPPAVNQYVQFINLQVPPPIYHSIANMTRVVVWEAKRALEIGVEVERIQWTAVNRNELGGINLHGLYYDSPQSNSDGDPLMKRVLAHQYEIKSDRWGHIIEADIKPARVLQRPERDRAREITLGDELFSPLPNQSVESERP